MAELAGREPLLQELSFTLFEHRSTWRRNPARIQRQLACKYMLASEGLKSSETGFAISSSGGLIIWAGKVWGSGEGQVQRWVEQGPLSPVSKQ